MHCIYKGQEFEGEETGENRNKDKMHTRHLILNRYRYIENGSMIHLDIRIKDNNIKF